MGKYIIEVGDAYVRHGLERTLTILVRINEHEDHWMDTRIPVTPYTEPDTNEAYQRGCEEGYAVGEAKKNSVEDEAYQRGLNDAWEAARKIANMPYGEEEKAFGSGGWKFIINHTTSEAIEKIRQYEQEKKKQIQVGDEVISPDGKGVVTEINDRIVRIMYSNGSGYVTQLEELTRTGRHFPEIATVLAKMEEKS